jgi:hypothetical protein
MWRYVPWWGEGIFHSHKYNIYLPLLFAEKGTFRPACPNFYLEWMHVEQASLLHTRGSSTSNSGLMYNSYWTFLEFYTPSHSRLFYLRYINLIPKVNLKSEFHCNHLCLQCIYSSSPQTPQLYHNNTHCSANFTLLTSLPHHQRPCNVSLCGPKR